MTRLPKKDYPSDDEVDAYTVEEWCRRHRISVVSFYRLKKQGKAPRIKYVGSKPLITREASREWRMADES